MFPFPAPFQKTPQERNKQRDEDVLRYVRDARAALQGMVLDLSTLEDALTSDEWTDRSKPGHGYHRAEFVGRQFSETHHNLRRFHDAEVLAVARAGGYEDETD